MLTSNLHPQILWECERTGKQYDPNDFRNDTVSYLSDYGDKRFTWRTHAHTDNTVCEWMEEKDE